MKSRLLQFVNACKSTSLATWTRVSGWLEMTYPRRKRCGRYVSYSLPPTVADDSSRPSPPSRLSFLGLEYQVPTYTVGSKGEPLFFNFDRGIHQLMRHSFWYSMNE